MIEKNELNLNSRGGTELMQEWLYERLPAHLKDAFQIIPSRVRTLADKPRLLWLHDLAEDREAGRLKDAEFRKQFARLIYVTHWQMQRYNTLLGVPFDEGTVLRNAIEPIPPKAKSKNGVKLIYHTTPHRGLNILVPVFIKLCELHEDIELDVYSSFKIYGWEARDKAFEQVFDLCRTHPKIRYHGAVSNAEVRAALQDAHIFAFPSIHPETSCIALIEAMSAGCLTVCSSLAALPETSANFAAMYQYVDDQQAHGSIFAQALHQAIKLVKAAPDDLQQQLKLQKQFFDRFYNWDSRILEWVALMEDLLRARRS